MIGVKQTMMRRILLLAILVIINLTPAFADEPEFKLINALNYHKSMFAAEKAEVYLRIPLGSATESVGSHDQDPERYTRGVPFAFRADTDGNIWILDSANKALKLFNREGSVLKNISLENCGPVVRDFAFDKNGGFWLLSPVDGLIYRMDASGKILSNIEGFVDARAIETGLLGELLVDMPTMASVLRFGNDELLKKQYPGDESLSLIEGVGGKLLVLEMNDKKVELLLRNVASPAENIPLADFPLDIVDPAVTYAGAQVLGRDREGNIFLNLIACHEEGAIYRDRLYKCTPTGKILAQKDIITTACLAPDLPRERVVTPDGKVLTFYLEENDYILCSYQL